MRILHISTQYTAGGAAIAAYRLHRALRALGHESEMFVHSKISDEPSVRAFARPTSPWQRMGMRRRRRYLERAMRPYWSTRPSGLEPFSTDVSEPGPLLIPQLPPADVINLHWVAGLVDYESFFTTVPQRTPVVWRLSDMNPFTGGCHYDGTCGRWQSACGACPQLGSNDENDLSREVFTRKRNAFAAVDPARLHIVALCQWMAELLRRSPLLSRFGVSVIPNGVDSDVFQPADTQMIRRVLGLPTGQRVLLFVAENALNRRKGFGLLREALDRLPTKAAVHLLSVGRGEPQAPVGFEHTHLGAIENPRLLSIVYAAADLFVIPAMEDNQPNTVLEAMACGVPVAGFASGGIPDMVRPGISGLLAAPGDSAGLARCIADLLFDDAARRVLASRCRKLVLDEYRRETQVERYVQLYRSMLSPAAMHPPNDPPDPMRPPPPRQPSITQPLPVP